MCNNKLLLYHQSFIMSCSNTLKLLTICILQFFLIIYLLSSKLYQIGYRNVPSVNSIFKTDSDDELFSGMNSISSSVFCNGINKQERECRFQNLCYKKDTDEFIFFHGNETRLFGLPENRNDPALLDLSSVDDHNAKYFYYTDILSSHPTEFYGISYIRGKSILFHRFNPENLMHVIHDDLLPLYHTQRKYFPLTSNNINLIMMDRRLEGPYFDLYAMFSNHIITKNNFSKPLTCFEDVIVGLSKTTSWYQYGFKSPQGRIKKSSYPFLELFYFRNKFLSKVARNVEIFNLDIDLTSNFILLFSRSTTRKFLNEAQLIFKLSTHFKMAVKMINLEGDDIFEIVQLISHAYIVVGVHGAHLVTSLFMKPGSTLVEIFPFGVPAKNYTPYKALAQLIDVNYIAWENMIEANSIHHEEWPSELGGISHLSGEMQKEILETKIVPAHLCCKNPFWLFRIYQDTVVDVKSFLNRLDEQLGGLKNKSDTHDIQSNSFIYPAHIDHIKCTKKNGSVILTWRVPWNVKYLDQSETKYHVLVMASRTNDSSSSQDLYEVHETKIIYPNSKFHTYRIYIRCIFYNNFGKYSNKFEC